MSEALLRLLDSVWYRGHPLGWLLAPVGIVYGFAAAARRALYQRGILARVAIGRPVVVVGNLSVGGTGKTPCVIWLALRLSERGHRPGIVSRGYGGNSAHWPREVTADSDPAEVGDEPVLIARRAACRVVVGPDRVAAARRLLAGGDIDVVVADDGLQHYRLGRAVEIAVVDGARGLGSARCLPAGPLREPASRLATVDAVVTNGGDWGPSGAFRGVLAPTGVRQTRTGVVRALAEFRGKRVHAVAGIGHPERFFALLEAHGITVVRHPLPDHARIEPADLEFADADPVLITEKDEVKCRPFAHADVWCVLVEFALAAPDEERLLALVETKLQAAA